MQHLEGFVSRHIATSDSDHLEMLALLGVSTVDDLIDPVSYTHLTLPTKRIV